MLVGCTDELALAATRPIVRRARRLGVDTGRRIRHRPVRQPRVRPVEPQVVGALDGKLVDIGCRRGRRRGLTLLTRIPLPRHGELNLLIQTLGHGARPG